MTIKSRNGWEHKSQDKDEWPFLVLAALSSIQLATRDTTTQTNTLYANSDVWTKVLCNFTIYRNNIDRIGSFNSSYTDFSHHTHEQTCMRLSNGVCWPQCEEDECCLPWCQGCSQSGQLLVAGLGPEPGPLPLLVSGARPHPSPGWGKTDKRKGF